MDVLNFRTTQHEELLDITSHVQRLVTESGTASGLAVVFSPHTTAAITFNENADPDVRHDLLQHLRKLIPNQAGFRHMEGNSDAHLKGGLTGFTQTFIIEEGQIQLGTWQSIYFAEFDGPRQRKVWVQIIGSS